MDNELRELERSVQADPADLAARKNLSNARIRLGLCPDHGLRAKYYDPVTSQPDPVGWGTGCPACEEALYCSSGVCDMDSCHHCNPNFECEYAHDNCSNLFDNLLHYGQEASPYDPFEEEEEEVDTGEYDCGDCRGTGEGYPPGTNCSGCGGSGVPRRPRNWMRPADSYPDPNEYYYDEEPWDGPY